MASGSPRLPGSGSKRPKWRDPLVVGQRLQPDARRRAVVAEAQDRLREVGRLHRVGELGPEALELRIGLVARRDGHRRPDMRRRRGAAASAYAISAVHAARVNPGMRCGGRRSTICRTESGAGLVAAGGGRGGDRARQLRLLRSTTADLIAAVIPAQVGGFAETLSLAGWVRALLMPVFFLVLGMELKFELLRGELSNPRRLALPALARAGRLRGPGAGLPGANRRQRPAGWAIGCGDRRGGGAGGAQPGRAAARRSRCASC